MEKASHRALGYTTAIAQAIFYSMMGIFSKLLYATGLDAQQVTFLRFAFTVVILGIVLILWRKHALISRQAAVYVQSIFFFLSAITYLLAVQYMNAGRVTVVFYTFPAVGAILDVAFFHAKLTWRVAFALALSVLGVFFISNVLLPGAVAISPLGVVFSVASCITFAIYSVLIQKTARVESSFTVTLTLSLVSLAASTVFFFPEIGATLGIDLYQAALVIGLAVISTILPIALFIVAIRYIGATKASILSLAETPASLFLAWIILGETLTIWQGIGTVLIVAAILVVTIKSKDAQEA